MMEGIDERVGDTRCIGFAAKIGHRSTERGLPFAGSNKVPKMASSSAVPVTAEVPFRPYRPAWPFLKSNIFNELLCTRNALKAGTAPPNLLSSMYRASSGL